MASFRYEAADQISGKVQRGRIDADSARSARALLRSRGLIALDLVDVSGKPRRKLFARPRFSKTELSWITRQLANLLAAGISLESALTATIEQADRKPVADVLAAVRSDIRAGHRLCDAMASHPLEFPAVYCALIDAGEQSGDLSKVMEKLANYLQSQHALSSKILTALVYPIIVSVVALAIVVFLMVHVVPQVVGAFTGTGQSLPWPTVVLLFVSAFLQTWGWQALLGLIISFAMWRLYLRGEGARLRWHSRVLKLPVAGRYVLGANTERFASTLAILTGSGVPLLVSLQAATRTLSNARLKTAATEAAERVREGGSLARALHSSSTFPPILIHMIESGERTGDLASMLERTANILSGDLEQKALRLTAILEPVLTVVMGAFVLFIVLAIMLPIIEINQLIQ